MGVGRPKSVAAKAKSLRESIGYSFKNKYGEGQRDDEDDSSSDEAPMVASRMSNKERMSRRI